MGVLLTGCSDPYAGRHAVSGTVKLEGQPLDQGSIMFMPLEGQDTSGDAEIKNGAYTIPRSAGLKPGNYLVRITSGDGKTADIRDEEAASPGGSTNIISVDRIPAEWNERSEKQVEMKDESAEFNFDIPKAVDTTKIKPKGKKKK
jgi:hypothetical protein